MIDLKPMSVAELLGLYANILEELRGRGVVRTANNPVADYAETLFCQAFDWQRADKEAKGYDATDANGVRYEIKARRLTIHSKSRQVSAIRSRHTFAFLAGVLFKEDFTIFRAALIPVAVVKRRSERAEHVNSWRFLLHDDIWAEPGVQDVTRQLVSFVKRTHGMDQKYLSRRGPK